jgi:hypothetical protein
MMNWAHVNRSIYQTIVLKGGKIVLYSCTCHEAQMSLKNYSP